MVDTSSSESVEKKLREAIGRLCERDRFLLENDVNERSISHKLAEHLQEQFPDWHVDCEYNRNYDLVKRLNIDPPDPPIGDTQGKTVYPDIVVHHRNTDANLLVIEIKKSTNAGGRRFDIEKLRLFTTELGYTYGAFVELAAGTENIDHELEFGDKDHFQ